jgi:ribosomal protein S6
MLYETMQYELNYLIGENKEADLERIKEEVTGAVKEEGGKFIEPQVIEKRRLAYQIKHIARGTYVIQRFEVNEEELESGEKIHPIVTLTKKFNLHPDILRFVIVKTDTLPELKTREEKERAKNIESKPREFKKQPAPVIQKETEKEEKLDSKKKETKTLDEKLEEILNI